MASTEELEAQILAEMESNPEAYAAEESNVLVIDNDLRTIAIPEGIKNLGVESEDDVHRLYFQMAKTYGEFDLSTFDIRINYKNGNIGDVYAVEDKNAEGDVITFSWLVGRNAVKTKGATQFIVCLKKSDSSGIVQQEFNTTVASLNVLEGLETTEQVLQENPDIIEQILKKIDGLTSISPEDIATAVEAYLSENPPSGMTADEKAQLNKNTEDISSLSEEIGNLSGGAPTPVSVASDMTDTTKIYLYTGSEDGYIAGNWYYYNGSAWISGGKYGETTTTEETIIEPLDDDIPKVFFGDALQQTKDEAVVSFRYISKTKDVSGYAEIKAQGNSSMSYAKKNQTVKMFKDAECTKKLKIDFKGWGEQNKHVYKANWIDLSHARNVVSARLWSDVVKSRANYVELPELLKTSPNQGAIDGFPVKVYANGVYQGRYTLNIPKDKWAFNMDDALDEHCVLCGENYASGCFRASASINGNDWTDEIHDTVPDSIKTRWNEVISFVMNSTDEEFKSGIGDYFYVDSLIDYHLFGLASCGLDAYGKNQIYITYDGQKWIADMYDMDSTWGLYWNGSKFVETDFPRTSYEDFVSSQSSGEGNLLYIRMEQLFWEELQDRWAELKVGVLSIENIINRFERFTDIAPSELVKEDYASTTGGGKFTGIPSQSTNNIQQIRAYALARQEWCDKYIAGLTPVDEAPCTGVSLSAETLTFTGAGTQTLTATVEPDGCTDTVTWESNDTSIATVSDGVVTAIANGSAIITAYCGDFSESCNVEVSGISNPIPCTGITLDKIELSFAEEGSQILTAVITPSDTTDQIVWSSDNESVATVENGVVTVVGDGSCVITAICGVYSASCSVSVALSLPDGMLYRLPSATTFDGTNYIDTGVRLFDEDKPFTILVDWAHTTSVFINNNHTVVHCMLESSGYPGLCLQYSSNSIEAVLNQTQKIDIMSYNTDGINKEDFNTIKMAYIKDSDGMLTVARRYNSTGDVLTSSVQGTYVQVTNNLLLGCYQTIDGTKGRFAKGIMNACEVYDYAMTAEEVDVWLTAQ